VSRFRQTLKRNALSQGFVLKRATDDWRLISIIDMLRPCKTDHELIRVGGPQGGGYLIPNDLSAISMCFSPGVGDTASFEKDLLEKFKIPSCLADGSVEKAPNDFIPHSFVRKFIGGVDNKNYMTLDNWVNNEEAVNDSDDLLLQMDIEGSEYISILSTSEKILKRFRIIALEIHGVENWGDPDYFTIVESFFEKILKDFTVVHLHPNNASPLFKIGRFISPSTFEMTLIRNDRISARENVTSLPHPFDKACVPEKVDILFPPNWYVYNQST
jgi:hypothetical protein